MTTDQQPEREPQRFAVYDETLTQYVTLGDRSTFDSERDAGKAKGEAGKLRRHKDHKLTVRPVG